MIHRYPVNYIGITQFFKKGSHYGLDLGWNNNYGGSNQPIFASADGTVYATNDYDKTGKSWGNYVKLSHGGNEYTLYAHLKDGIKVKNGQKVKQGDLLGYMGTTGKSQGNHLHFEIYKGGASTSYRVDPLPLTYVFGGQIVHEEDKNVVKYYTPITTPVKRDETKDQLKTNKLLNVRSGAGTNQGIIGQVDAGNIYNFYETKVNGEYTWYKIAEKQWLAQDKAGTYLTIYEKEDEEMTKELQEQVKALQTRIAELEKEIIEKDQVILEQKKTILEMEEKITELENRTWLSMFVEWLKAIFKKNE